MPTIRALALCLAGLLPMPARAAGPPPIFDRHLHYNAEATAAYPVADVLRRFRDPGVATIIATSRPNEGARALVAAAAADPAAAPRMEDVATCVFLYDVRAVTADAQKLAEICVACTLKVKEAVGMLESMDHADAILGLCGDIDRLESEADFVFRTALAKLFREESDAKQILKLKEVYQLLESITDKAEDVANVIEGIVLENA